MEERKHSSSMRASTSRSPFHAQEEESPLKPQSAGVPLPPLLSSSLRSPLEGSLRERSLLSSLRLPAHPPAPAAAAAGLAASPADRSSSRLFASYNSVGGAADNSTANNANAVSGGGGGGGVSYGASFPTPPPFPSFGAGTGTGSSSGRHPDEDAEGGDVLANPVGGGGGSPTRYPQGGTSTLMGGEAYGNSPNARHPDPSNNINTKNSTQRDDGSAGRLLTSPPPLRRQASNMTGKKIGAGASLNPLPARHQQSSRIGQLGGLSIGNQRRSGLGGEGGEGGGNSTGGGGGSGAVVVTTAIGPTCSDGSGGGTRMAILVPSRNNSQLPTQQQLQQRRRSANVLEDAQVCSTYPPLPASDGEEGDAHTNGANDATDDDGDGRRPRDRDGGDTTSGIDEDAVIIATRQPTLTVQNTPQRRRSRLQQQQQRPESRATTTDEDEGGRAVAARYRNRSALKAAEWARRQETAEGTAEGGAASSPPKRGSALGGGVGGRSPLRSAARRAGAGAPLSSDEDIVLDLPQVDKVPSAIARPPRRHPRSVLTKRGAAPTDDKNANHHHPNANGGGELIPKLADAEDGDNGDDKDGHNDGSGDDEDAIDDGFEGSVKHRLDFSPWPFSLMFCCYASPAMEHRFMHFYYGEGQSVLMLGVLLVWMIVWLVAIFYMPAHGLAVSLSIIGTGLFCTAAELALNYKFRPYKKRKRSRRAKAKAKSEEQRREREAAELSYQSNSMGRDGAAASREPFADEELVSVVGSAAANTPTSHPPAAFPAVGRQRRIAFAPTPTRNTSMALSLGAGSSAQQHQQQPATSDDDDGNDDDDEVFYLRWQRKLQEMGVIAMVYRLLALPTVRTVRYQREAIHDVYREVRAAKAQEESEMAAAQQTIVGGATLGTMAATRRNNSPLTPQIGEGGGGNDVPLVGDGGLSPADNNNIHANADANNHSPSAAAQASAKKSSPSAAEAAGRRKTSPSAGTDGKGTARGGGGGGRGLTSGQAMMAVSREMGRSIAALRKKGSKLLFVKNNKAADKDNHNHHHHHHHAAPHDNARDGALVGGGDADGCEDANAAEGSAAEKEGGGLGAAAASKKQKRRKKPSSRLMPIYAIWLYELNATLFMLALGAIFSTQVTFLLSCDDDLSHYFTPFIKHTVTRADVEAFCRWSIGSHLLPPISFCLLTGRPKHWVSLLVLFACMVTSIIFTVVTRDDYSDIQPESLYQAAQNVLVVLLAVVSALGFRQLLERAQRQRFEQNVIRQLKIWWLLEEKRALKRYVDALLPPSVRARLIHGKVIAGVGVVASVGGGASQGPSGDMAAAGPDEGGGEDSAQHAAVSSSHHHHTRSASSNAAAIAAAIAAEQVKRLSSGGAELIEMMAIGADVGHVTTTTSGTEEEEEGVGGEGAAAAGLVIEVAAGGGSPDLHGAVVPSPQGPSPFSLRHSGSQNHPFGSSPADTFPAGGGGSGHNNNNNTTHTSNTTATTYSGKPTPSRQSHRGGGSPHSSPVFEGLLAKQRTAAITDATPCGTVTVIDIFEYVPYCQRMMVGESVVAVAMLHAELKSAAAKCRLDHSFTYGDTFVAVSNLLQRQDRHAALSVKFVHEVFAALYPPAPEDLYQQQLQQQLQLQQQQQLLLEQQQMAAMLMMAQQQQQQQQQQQLPLQQEQQQQQPAYDVVVGSDGQQYLLLGYDEFGNPVIAPYDPALAQQQYQQQLQYQQQQQEGAEGGGAFAGAEGEQQQQYMQYHQQQQPMLPMHSGSDDFVPMGFGGGHHDDHGYLSAGGGVSEGEGDDPMARGIAPQQHQYYPSIGDSEPVHVEGEGEGFPAETVALSPPTAEGHYAQQMGSGTPSTPQQRQSPAAGLQPPCTPPPCEVPQQQQIFTSAPQLVPLPFLPSPPPPLPSPPQRRGPEMPQVRVALHSGPLSGGVVGNTQLRYAIFGPTVSTATESILGLCGVDECYVMISETTIMALGTHAKVHDVSPIALDIDASLMPPRELLLPRVADQSPTEADVQQQQQNAYISAPPVAEFVAPPAGSACDAATAFLQATGGVESGGHSDPQWFDPTAAGPQMGGVGGGDVAVAAGAALPIVSVSTAQHLANSSGGGSSGQYYGVNDGHQLAAKPTEGEGAVGATDASNAYYQHHQQQQQYYSQYDQQQMLANNPAAANNALDGPHQHNPLQADPSTEDHHMAAPQPHSANGDDGGLMAANAPIPPTIYVFTCVELFESEEINALLRKSADEKKAALSSSSRHNRANGAGTPADGGSGGDVQSLTSVSSVAIMDHHGAGGASTSSSSSSSSSSSDDDDDNSAGSDDDDGGEVAPRYVSPQMRRRAAEKKRRKMRARANRRAANPEEEVILTEVVCGNNLSSPSTPMTAQGSPTALGNNAAQKAASNNNTNTNNKIVSSPASPTTAPPTTAAATASPPLRGAGAPMARAAMSTNTSVADTDDREAGEEEKAAIAKELKEMHDGAIVPEQVSPELTAKLLTRQREIALRQTAGHWWLFRLDSQFATLQIRRAFYIYHYAHSHYYSHLMSNVLAIFLFLFCLAVVFFETGGLLDVFRGQSEVYRWDCDASSTECPFVAPYGNVVGKSVSGGLFLCAIILTCISLVIQIAVRHTVSHRLAQFAGKTKTGADAAVTVTGRVADDIHSSRNASSPTSPYRRKGCDALTRCIRQCRGGRMYARLQPILRTHTDLPHFEIALTHDFNTIFGWGFHTAILVDRYLLPYLIVTTALFAGAMSHPSIVGNSPIFILEVLVVYLLFSPAPAWASIINYAFIFIMYLLSIGIVHGVSRWTILITNMACVLAATVVSLLITNQTMSSFAQFLSLALHKDALDAHRQVRRAVLAATVPAPLQEEFDKLRAAISGHRLFRGEAAIGTILVQDMVLVEVRTNVIRSFTMASALRGGGEEATGTSIALLTFCQRQMEKALAIANKRTADVLAAYLLEKARRKHRLALISKGEAVCDADGNDIVDYSKVRALPPAAGKDGKEGAAKTHWLTIIRLIGDTATIAGPIASDEPQPQREEAVLCLIIFLRTLQILQRDSRRGGGAASSTAHRSGARGSGTTKGRLQQRRRSPVVGGHLRERHASSQYGSSQYYGGAAPSGAASSAYAATPSSGGGSRSHTGDSNHVVGVVNTAHFVPLQNGGGIVGAISSSVFAGAAGGGSGVVFGGNDGLPPIAAGAEVGGHSPLVAFDPALVAAGTPVDQLAGTHGSLVPPSSVGGVARNASSPRGTTLTALSGTDPSTASGVPMATATTPLGAASAMSSAAFNPHQAYHGGAVSSVGSSRGGGGGACMTTSAGVGGGGAATPTLLQAAQQPLPPNVPVTVRTVTRRHPIVYTAAAVCDIGITVMHNSLYPSFDIQGNAAYRSASLLKAAPTGALVVTEAIAKIYCYSDLVTLAIAREAERLKGLRSLMDASNNVPNARRGGGGGTATAASRKNQSHKRRRSSPAAGRTPTTPQASSLFPLSRQQSQQQVSASGGGGVVGLPPTPLAPPPPFALGSTPGQATSGGGGSLTPEFGTTPTTNLLLLAGGSQHQPQADPQTPVLYHGSGSGGTLGVMEAGGASMPPMAGAAAHGVGVSVVAAGEDDAESCQSSQAQESSSSSATPSLLHGNPLVGTDGIFEPPGVWRVRGLGSVAVYQLRGSR